MKKIAPFLIALSAVWLTSCETTKEISLNSDGSGNLLTTTDMSSLIGMAKMAGKADQLEKAGQQSMDTTIAMASMVDLLTNVSPEEKELVKKGSLQFTMDLKNDKFLTRLSFPFTEGNQVTVLDKLSSRVVQEAMQKAMDSASEQMPPELEGAGIPSGSIDDYYTVTYSKGRIEKKLNKEKYAGLNDDKGMQSLKQMSSMGMGNSTIVINLPAPAKKAEGKKVTLSEDKKKVTIVNSAEDFFDDGSSLEFKIEY